MENKIKSVVAIVKMDIQVGRLAARSKNKTDQVSRMNAEYKNHKTIPAGTIVVLREGWTGADGEDRVYMHGKGWFKTNKASGVTLDEALQLKSSRATFETLFPTNHKYENLETNIDKLKTLVPVAASKIIEELDEKEKLILSEIQGGASIKEAAERAGYAESTTREKLFGRSKNGARIPGIMQKMEASLLNQEEAEAV